jgi:hypothetical protein
MNNMDGSSGISVALKSCGPDVANDLLCHGVATLLLQIQGVPCCVVSPLASHSFQTGQFNLPRHGYTAVSFPTHSPTHQDSAVAIYLFRFSVMLVSDGSLPSDQSAVTAIAHPHLINFLGDPTSAKIFPIATFSSSSSARCHAIVSR